MTAAANPFGQGVIMDDAKKEEFKDWCRNHKTMALGVCEAQALSEVTRERVDKYVEPLFLEFGFTYCGDLAEKLGKAGQPVKSSADLYLCDDPRVPDFYAACDTAHRQHGYTDLREGHCPALMAENLLIEAQNLLIEEAKPIFNVETWQLQSEQRTRYLDLLLGACLAKDCK